MLKVILLIVISIFSFEAYSAEVVSLPGLEINIKDDNNSEESIATALKVAFGLTILSLAPAILIMMTSFTRIVIVLSLLRHALGMQQTPPNTVIISLSLFLTIFTMFPVIEKIKTTAYEPYMEKSQNLQDSLTNASDPIKKFMVSQTREQDLALMIDISKSDKPQSLEDIQLVTLIPAFIISELKTAFQIGFVIFLPFILIDIVVASILMSMGMLMVPPMMISLPIKILVFVLIDGWNLVISSLLGSFL